MNKKILWLFCAVSLWPLAADAQSNDYLWVNMADGTAVSFAIDDLQKITFTDNGIAVAPVDRTVQTFAFAAVQKLTFEDSPVITHSPAAGSQTTLIYFNPKSKEIVVESAKTIGNIVILDIAGRTVSTRNVASLRETINVSHLPEGVYIVKTAGSVKKLTIYK
jgi:hypothetical protein